MIVVDELCYGYQIMNATLTWTKAGGLLRRPHCAAGSAQRAHKEGAPTLDGAHRFATPSGRAEKKSPKGSAARADRFLRNSRV